MGTIWGKEGGPLGVQILRACYKLLSVQSLDKGGMELYIWLRNE